MLLFAGAALLCGFLLWLWLGSEENPQAGSHDLNPATLHAPLFKLNQSWEYTVEISTQHYDPGSLEADAQGNVHSSKVQAANCHVTEVVSKRDWVSSRIRCDGALAPEVLQAAIPVVDGLIEGQWFANDKGLWFVGEPGPDHDSPDIQPDRMLLSARPEPLDVTIENPDEGGGASMRVVQANDAWCVTRSSWGGDEAGDTYCFRQDTGLSHGRRYFAGGQYREVRFCVDIEQCRGLAD